MICKTCKHLSVNTANAIRSTCSETGTLVWNNVQMGDAPDNCPLNTEGKPIEGGETKSHLFVDTIAKPVAVAEPDGFDAIEEDESEGEPVVIEAEAAPEPEPEIVFAPTDPKPVNLNQNQNQNRNKNRNR